MSALYYVVTCSVQGFSGNLSDVTVASSRYDIFLCSEITDMRHVSKLLVTGFARPFLSCQSRIPLARGMATHIRDGYWAFRYPKFENDCCKMLNVRVCGARQNFYVFSLYCNPDLDDRIFDCLLTSMAAVEAEDVSASFLFVAD